MGLGPTRRWLYSNQTSTLRASHMRVGNSDMQRTTQHSFGANLALAESFHGIRTGCHCRSDSRSLVAALPGATGCMSVSRVKKWTTCRPVDLGKQESKPIPKPFSLSYPYHFLCFGSSGSVNGVFGTRQLRALFLLVVSCAMLEVPLTLPQIPWELWEL